MFSGRIGRTGATKNLVREKNWWSWTCLKPGLTCWCHVIRSIALWGDLLCHEGGDLHRRTVQPEESLLLGKRSPVEIGLEPPARQRQKVVEQIVETVSESAFSTPRRPLSPRRALRRDQAGRKLTSSCRKGPSPKPCRSAAWLCHRDDTRRGGTRSRESVGGLCSGRRCGTAGLSSSSQERFRRETVQGHQIRFRRSSGVHVVQVLVQAGFQGRRLRQPASDGRLAFRFSRGVASVACTRSL